MILNSVLLLATILFIIFLIRHLRKSYVIKSELPICKFSISKPQFEINDTEKRAIFKVYTKNKDFYYRDFPIGFKFYSTDKFRSKIRISYVVTGDDDEEIIYDRVVEFDKIATNHIYYINDVIMGSIDIDIETYPYYGNPRVLFEILQNNKCELDREHKLEIIFPD